MCGIGMVTTAMFSASRNKVFLETSDNLIIPMEVSKFKRNYPVHVRKKLLKVDLARQLMMLRKNKKAGILSVAKRQEIIIKKILGLMN